MSSPKLSRAPWLWIVLSIALAHQIPALHFAALVVILVGALGGLSARIAGGAQSPPGRAPLYWGTTLAVLALATFLKPLPIAVGAGAGALAGVLFDRFGQLRH